MVMRSTWVIKHDLQVVKKIIRNGNRTEWSTIHNGN